MSKISPARPACTRKLKYRLAAELPGIHCRRLELLRYSGLSGTKENVVVSVSGVSVSDSHTATHFDTFLQMSSVLNYCVGSNGVNSFGIASSFKRGRRLGPSSNFPYCLSQTRGGISYLPPHI